MNLPNRLFFTGVPGSRWSGIAQQLEEHIPALVDTIDGKKTVNYDGIIAFLIEAIKELNAKLESK